MRRTREGSSLAPALAPRAPRTRRAAPPTLSLQTALLALVALSLVFFYVYTNTTDPLLLTNRPSGFRAPGAVGVHPDYEEASILEFAEPTELEGYALPTKPFAYLFYVTGDSYACAALHAMLRLVQELRMNTRRIDLVVLYSASVSPAMVELMETTVRARTIPVVRILADVSDPTWQESLTKLRAFEDFGYQRVVYLDADSVPLQNLDDLFLLPSAPLYAPTAYWLPQPFFSTALMVLEPSTTRFDELLTFARSHSDSLNFDMELLNSFFKISAVLLPPEYSVLNSDFRATPEARNALFATTRELRARAKLVHFSCRPDGSYGKPWLVETHDLSYLDHLGLDPFFGQLFVDFWRTEETVCKG